MKPGGYVKLKTPEWTHTFNQGEHPAGMLVNIGADSITIPWNSLLKIKTKCNNGVCEFPGNSQYGSIDIRYLKKNIDQFEIIKQKKTKKGE
jgi:hypothetical protein